MIGGNHCSSCGADTGCIAGLCDRCFNRQEVVDAVISGHINGVKPRIRIVYPRGYLLFLDADYPIEPEFELVREAKE
jgi:hypothetical protein